MKDGQLYSPMDAASTMLAKPSPKHLERGLASGKYRIELDGLQKQCCRCHDYWPADSEFFYTDKKGSDGLFGFCKACYIEKRFPNGRRIQKLENVVTH